MAEGSYFRKVMGKSPEELDNEEIDLLENELKRKFETDYDKASGLILEKKRVIKDIEKNKFKDFSLNNWREAKSDIRDHEAAKKEIAAAYKDFFNEDIKR